MPALATRPETARSIVPLYVSIGMAGQMLGVARTTLYRMIESGRLQAIRTPGGHRRILRESVIALQHELAVKPRAPAPAPEPPRSWEPAARSAPLPVVRAPASVAAGGTTFTAALPQDGPLRVLLVDDDLVMLTFLKHLVGHAHPDARICTAGDTTQAVAVLQQLEPPDIVITDLSMPVDGFRLAWWLHVKPEYRHVRVVALSALSPDAVARDGGLPPNVVWMPKPVQVDRMLGLMQAALDARAA